MLLHYRVLTVQFNVVATLQRTHCTHSLFVSFHYRVLIVQFGNLLQYVLRVFLLYFGSVVLLKAVLYIPLGLLHSMISSGELLFSWQCNRVVLCYIGIHI